ncbi:hypothetical protein DJ568_00710 [Mucilaginibacter hurinus]|uniref:ATPase AAA-type core domain-containing protein n=1 Tax=Mucilaginibacter hurinus TaxID=2201324 RepID=A0A367GSK2_9SPHI|nr:AAA family ATPase [Mucilaginibacter hurinus]RCH56414.1 hypothetical protein DJ568_00710 [Mucilaginibacter hurinus]
MQANQYHKVKLSELYLDPNNYRFIDNDNYVRITSTDILREDIQKRTKNFLYGKNYSEVSDLISSFKANGYLPVDQIQVRKLDDQNHYLVLEGNRRIAALKYLQEQYHSNHDIGNLSPEIFDNIPIVIAKNVNENHYKILMGLKHISGNKKWPAVNQAQLLKSLIDEGLTESQVKASLGISTVALRRYLRTLALVEMYKSSDYGDQFKTEMFNIFSETIKQPNIMQWIGWDDDAYKAKNISNLSRFFSWISEDERPINEENEELGTEKLERIITKGDDLRELSKLINDKDAIDKIENSRSIAQAYLSSDRIGIDKFDNTLEVIDKHLSQAFDFSRYATSNSKDRLEDIRKKFNALLLSNGFYDVLQNSDIQRKLYVDVSGAQFSNIEILSYKNISNLKIDKLNQINIFGGENNTGKTSLLEAIYLLVTQNDTYSFIETQRRRGKFLNDIPNVLLNFKFTTVDLKGFFLGRQASTKISQEIESDNFDKTSYISSILFESYYDNKLSESKIRLFEHDRKMFFKQPVNLCNVKFSSPFAIHTNTDLIECHELSVHSKSIDKILSFIQENIDPNIQKIELVGQGPLQRFVVTNKINSETADITSYGDGLQRIFYITLLFAACHNGIVLIDEIENAIHHELFIKFTRFIQELSNEFNVQVFVTSHSKECIDAFFNNDYENDKISAYRLTKKDNQIEILHTEGERFSRLIKNFDADLRGNTK